MKLLMIHKLRFIYSEKKKKHLTKFTINSHVYCFFLNFCFRIYLDFISLTRRKFLNFKEDEIILFELTLD